MTNGVSAVLLNTDNFGGYDGTTTTPYYPFTRSTQVYFGDYLYHHCAYLPNYSVHFKFEYSVGISKSIRLETGVGYLMQGLTIKYTLTNQSNTLSSTSYCFIGDISIPLYVKYIKNLSNGAYIFTFGPNVILPTNQIYTTKDVVSDGASEPSQNGHQRFSSNAIANYSSLGFDLKMGYEKELTKAISIDICPIINFTNLFPFQYNKPYFNGQIPDIIQSYIGLDVAINFGLKK